MAPLEDELRTALRGRAATLTPSADPLAGVERRARGMRRRRVGASVAGTALAVLAVAGVVPALTPDRTAVPAPGDVATSAPSAAPVPTSRYAFDPDQPWEYRGDPSVLEDGALQTWQREWAVREPGAELVPLYGRVWEPSGLPEVVFASVDDDRDELLFGVATASESGSRFLVAGDTSRTGTTSFPVVLDGDEGQRLLVVADPDVARLTYAAGGQAQVEMAALAPGVATTPVTRPALDAYVVVGADGEQVERAGVPDEPARADDEAASAPDNVLDWPTRGAAVDPEVYSRAQDLLAANRDGVAPGDVEGKVLFSGDDDAGRRYLLGQFWAPGDAQADTLGILLTRQDGARDEVQLLRPLTDGTDAVALFLSPVNAQSRGELVVVPRPGTGQVEYAGDEAGEWTPKDTPGLDGVVLFERNPAAERGEAVDRVRLLDGDGREITIVTVQDLLCGKTSCG